MVAPHSSLQPATTQQHATEEANASVTDEHSNHTGMLGGTTAATSAMASSTTNPNERSTRAHDETSATSLAASTTLGTAGSAETNSPASSHDAESGRAFPSFIRHEVATFANGYFTSAFDVDGDGLRDIAALAAGGSEIVWFKNPSWERFSLTTDVDGVICMDPYDVDRDGDLDVTFASEFSMTATSSGGKVYWAEAPDDPTTSDAWPIHLIGQIPTAHRLRWADLTGDNNPELLVLPIFGRGSVSPEYVGAVEFTMFTPDDSITDSGWGSTVVNDSLLEVAHGMTIVDWDADGVDDVLAASNAGVHLFQPSIGPEAVQLAAGADGARPDRGSSEVSLGTLGDQRFLATVEPWHGTDLVIYTPSSEPAAPWQRTVVGTEFGKGHALLTADLNADGNHEIVAGDQDGRGALLAFHHDASGWKRVDLDVGSVAVVGIDIQDINADGALDIVAIGGSSNNLVWYENTGGSSN